MKGINVPIYMYENGTNVQMDTGIMLILQSDAFYDRYKTYTSWTTLQSLSNQHITGLGNIVNHYFGEPIISSETHSYAKMKSGGSFADFFVRAYSTLNMHLSAVFGTNTNTGAYKTINDSRYSSLMNNNEDDPHDQTYIIAGTPVSYVRVNSSGSFNIEFRVFKEDMFSSDGSINTFDSIGINLTGQLNATGSEITALDIKVHKDSTGWNWTPAFNILGAQGKETDVNNPFPDDDNPGGDGDGLEPINDPTGIPDLPDTSIANSGLITIYNPTLSQLQNLAAFLWSGLFDVDSFKKLFTDPMQAMIGLAILPKVPSSSGSKNIRFGNVDSGVSANYFSTQYCKQDCGSVRISKQVGSFLDYDQTKISLFLPFIGFREIDARDVMGASIQVVYNIDILNGSCAAFVKHSSRGVIYAFNGSCITNVPLTAANYSGAIQNAVSCVASGVGVLAGMATGAAPVTMASAASMLSAGANTIMNSKPQIQRSGNLGGSAGMLTAKKPFVIIERPNYSVPDYYQNYEGRMCNKTARLGSLSGFTMVEAVHLDNINATTGEIAEIEALLKGGVIL